MSDWRKVDLSAVEKEMERYQLLVLTMSREECLKIINRAERAGYTCFQCGGDGKFSLADIRSFAADILYLESCM